MYIMPKKIIITTGGTGGHFFPASATAEILLNRGYEVHLIIDARCKKYINSDLKYILHVIDCRINYKNYWTKFLSLLQILSAFYTALLLVYKIKPSIIVGFGSYATFPPILAGLLLRVPIIVHEQNCFVGKVNRFFTRFAKKIALSYEETNNFNKIYKDKVIYTGNIIRDNIRNIQIKDNFDNNPFRILVFGGSQGAKLFSSLIPETIKCLIKSNPDIKLYITQQATKEEQITINKIYTQFGINHNLSEFFYDMDKQYDAHDLVISRAGASTIAELSLIGLPAIFIPYPFAAENHQFYNAKALEDGHASWCFPQNIVTPELLAKKLLEIINNRTILKQASDNLLKRKNYGSAILSDTIEAIIS
jgi:UDP-N-acetylglucosamine--N-acetylmuramyl-(pentapeptide) pyrophosphoryl-undecaprenol N-acetylglucosamine transferase